MLYIAHIPKHTLLYYLWKYASYTNYAYKCKDKLIPLTIKQALIDAELNKTGAFSIYHCKTLFINISGDYLDTKTYNKHNGVKLAQKIINAIKLKELRRCSCQSIIF